MWYYEERSPTGQWHACKSDQYPTERMSEGQRRNLRNITKIPDNLADLPLEALRIVRPDFGKEGISFRVERRVRYA